MRMPLLFILGLSPIPISQESLGGYESAAMKISEAKDLSTNDKANSLYLLYSDYQSSIVANQAPMTQSQLHALFKLINLSFFYAEFAKAGHAPALLHDLRLVYEKLDKSGGLSNEELTATYDGMISQRDFTSAAQLIATHPGAGLADIPRITQSPSPGGVGPAVYILSEDGKGLDLHAADTSHDTLIVIVAQCHFARDVALMISKDKELSAAFAAGNAIWLESATSPLEIEDLRLWNEAFPHQPLSIAFDDKAWPLVDFSQSPAFFFFKNGKLVSQRLGWSAKTTRAALIESLQGIGLPD